MYLRGRIMSPSTKRKEQFPEIKTHNHVFSKPDGENITIGFTGDVMPVKGKAIELDDILAEKINSVDILVFNLEGIITAKKRFFALSHDSEILRFFSGLSKNKKILVNLANNHSGDFGKEEFIKSLKIIESYGFEPFGISEKPFADVGNFRFCGATYWSNQHFEPILQFKSGNLQFINQFATAGKTNILLPHWGYEMQMFPSRKQVEMAGEFLQHWDVIVGNHTHCPQPFSLIEVNGVKKPVAWSLGNFCYTHYNPNHYFSAFLTTRFNIENSSSELAYYDYCITQMDHTPKKIWIKPAEKPAYWALRRKKMMEILKLKDKNLDI
jgi:hypothetical protein